MEDKDLPIGDIDFVSSEDYDSKQDSLSLFVLHIITTYITSDIFQDDPLDQSPGELDVGGAGYERHDQGKVQELNILGLGLLLFKVLVELKVRSNIPRPRKGKICSRRGV